MKRIKYTYDPSSLYVGTSVAQEHYVLLSVAKRRLAAGKKGTFAVGTRLIGRSLDGEVAELIRTPQKYAQGLHVLAPCSICRPLLFTNREDSLDTGSGSTGGQLLVFLPASTTHPRAEILSSTPWTLTSNFNASLNLSVGRAESGSFWHGDNVVYSYTQTGIDPVTTTPIAVTIPEDTCVPRCQYISGYPPYATPSPLPPSPITLHESSTQYVWTYTYGANTRSSTLAHSYAPDTDLETQRIVALPYSTVYSAIRPVAHSTATPYIVSAVTPNDAPATLVQGVMQYVLYTGKPGEPSKGKFTCFTPPIYDQWLADYAMYFVALADFTTAVGIWDITHGGSPCGNAFPAFTVHNKQINFTRLTTGTITTNTTTYVSTGDAPGYTTIETDSYDLDTQIARHTLNGYYSFIPDVFALNHVSAPAAPGYYANVVFRSDGMFVGPATITPAFGAEYAAWEARRDAYYAIQSTAHKISVDRFRKYMKGCSDATFLALETALPDYIVPKRPQSTGLHILSPLATVTNTMEVSYVESEDYGLTYLTELPSVYASIRTENTTVKIAYTTSDGKSVSDSTAGTHILEKNNINYSTPGVGVIDYGIGTFTDTYTTNCIVHGQNLLDARALAEARIGTAVLNISDKQTTVAPLSDPKELLGSSITGIDLFVGEQSFAVSTLHVASVSAIGTPDLSFGLLSQVPALVSSALGMTPELGKKYRGLVKLAYAPGGDPSRATDEYNTGDIIIIVPISFISATLGELGMYPQADDKSYITAIRVQKQYAFNFNYIDGSFSFVSSKNIYSDRAYMDYATDNSELPNCICVSPSTSADDVLLAYDLQNASTEKNATDLWQLNNLIKSLVENTEHSVILL